MNKTIYKSILTLVFLILCNCLWAQVKTITINGTVVDTKGETLPGATVIVKNQPGLGVTTDINGKFKIKTGENEVLVVSFIGYQTNEVRINGKPQVTVTLKESSEQLEEIAVVGHGTQRKESVVGAISSIDPATLQISTGQVSNALAGNVAGIIAVQRSGEPGENTSEFWIRGISTFGANSKALVLVDGVERNFNEINVEDIEHFSVLKDASATAIYGSRGANGVVIITTKRGKEGKININFKAESGISTPSKMPDYLNASDYALLANEASVSRGKMPFYTPSEVEIIKYGLDPDLYPDINWREELLKDNTSNYKASLNLSGGSSMVRYYISGGYYNESGMYKYGNLNDYNTNVNYTRYNFRSNVDVNVTKTTSLSLGIGAWIVDQNKPGDGNSDAIWNSFANLTPVTVPFRYSNGLLPAYGSSADLMSPFAILTQTGYTTKWENKLETNIALKQDLSFITKGLTFTGRFSYDTYNYNDIKRLVRPELFRAEKQRDKNGQLVLRKVVDSSPLSQKTSAWGDKRFYTEATLNYNRLFNETHRVGGLLFYYQQEYGRNDSGGDILKAIPARNQAFSGRATYAYMDKYMFEFNFGYTGSENFEKGSRYGFFPAMALGWLVTKENFMANQDKITNLKLRYSIGQVGNDRLNARFPYITTIKHGAGYGMGENGGNNPGGLHPDIVGAQDLTWEVSTKQNIGVDLELFDSFKITTDIFRDRREKIFMKRNYINQVVGLLGNQKPWANVGIMESKGIDGTFSYTKKIDDFSYTLRGNFTYSNNEVVNYDEASNSLYYQQTEGYKWGQTRGLIALGLFKDQAEIDNSPKQTYGKILPGDIKYKDVNGDGKINDDDIVPIGHSTIPEVVYGFGLSMRYKQFDFSMLFQGTGNCDFFLGGNAAYPFAGGETGNVMSYVNNPKNRWISREISGSAETENPNAIYPRLSYGGNNNNNRTSTFWLRNSKYLRLKNVELGYRFNRKLLKRFNMSSARVFLIATNLFVFSPFDWWDPELASGNGARYPLQKRVNLGINVSF
ncbi:TonB-dependent receptor [Prolixibacteraceae bacterium JC049]|nr:TonB-dependent receptor [Prolixibacteraceae bacterium JC049]